MMMNRQILRHENNKRWQKRHCRKLDNLTDFLVGLFYDAFNNSDHRRMIEQLVNNELERIWKEAVIV
jgi:hypothetical protein